MRIAVCDEPHKPLVIREAKLDNLRPDEVRVRMVASGICHTDLAVLHGQLPVPFPVILGHEGAGIVEQVGTAVKNLTPGDRVVMTFGSCGQCLPCTDGSPTYCYDSFAHNFACTRPDGTQPVNMSDGQVHSNFFSQSSFATEAISTERNIIKIPSEADHIPLSQLAPMGCGMMTGAGAILRSLNVTNGRSLAVTGTGAVGLAAIMAARIRKAYPIIAVDIHQDRLDLARELGATHSFISQDDTTEKIMALLPDGLNFAFDTTGLTSVIETAFEWLAPRGILGLVGASHPEDVLTFNESRFMGGGRTVKGILGGDSDLGPFVQSLIRYHADGKFPLERLIGYFDFENINQALDAAHKGEVIKPVIRISDEH